MSESTTGKEIDPGGVNHPAHYNIDPSGVECIDIVRWMSFNVGSAFKYLFRAGKKSTENPIKDLNKAVWYLKDELSMFPGDRLLVRTNRSKFAAEMERVIDSREGDIQQAMYGIYWDNLISAIKYIENEIERLSLELEPS